ncbi:hypothetical protein QR665_17065 [Acinetobacter gerneri]|uniref:hypothetical protein n=1 Tax=Acinetobacter gerneri TaxID=202952 RepID=UPI002935A984|nr:hypothetical protein [Acinetobacter gerneri]MDV2441157.1 hypothetical protein [Acinetobacter gerneri]
MEYKLPMKVKPPVKKDGDIIFHIDVKLVNKADEIALGLQYICNRYLYGQGYRKLMGDFFDKMGLHSGTLIKPFIISSHVIPQMSFPGDIDFLIIPYENDQLILSKALVIELKIIRAKFIKQQKSPNEYGFSQAKGLIESGFPYVAVMHLIISDESPQSHWRDVLIAKVVDAKSGKIELIETIKKDMMPISLMERGFGRLVHNCPDERIGLLATYFAQEKAGNWLPCGKEAKFNDKCTVGILDKIAEYYYQNYTTFLDTRKYPPIKKD